MGFATLTGADLRDATLTGADLGGATLTGAILGHNAISPLSPDQAKDQAAEFSQTLQGLPRYQGQQGVANLETRSRRHLTAIRQPVDFSNLKASTACLGDVPKIKPLNCGSRDDPKARQETYKIWLDLACHDDAKPAYIVKSLGKRALFGSEFSDFPDFAILLADNLDNPKTCAGLAGLDQALKDEILAAAAEFKTWQTENLKAQSQPAQAKTQAPRR
ncbi:MAG: hypothetical protein CTY29_08715 [Methylobacter sp.]|nr:MAG: hypothetical protein CTY29_08715 [Methylobacter sp.]